MCYIKDACNSDRRELYYFWPKFESLIFLGTYFSCAKTEVLLQKKETLIYQVILILWVYKSFKITKNGQLTTEDQIKTDRLAKTWNNQLTVWFGRCN